MTAEREPARMFAEGDQYEGRIEASRQATRDLLEERNRAMARWVHEEGASVRKAAKAFHMGRQNAHVVLKLLGDPQ